jgi:hypothetical protein
MRLILVSLLGLVATTATGQTINRPGTVSATPEYIPRAPIEWYPFLAGETPSMTRARLERQRKGWAFLDANANSLDDIKALAKKCHNFTAVPDYCSIPEIRKMARAG